MDILKKKLFMNKVKCRNILQFVLDNDFNVPDSKPDIYRQVQNNGEVRLVESRVMNSKLNMEGVLAFNFLYLGEGVSCPEQSIRGEIPFDEVMNLNEECSGDNVGIHFDIEDLTVTIINSRKINVKAVICARVVIEELVEEGCAIGVSGNDEVQERKTSMPVTLVAVDTKDAFRIRETIALPSGKEDIKELIYTEAEAKNIEVRLLEDKFTVRGDIQVFVIYESTSEDTPMNYYETELPFTTGLDCSGCGEDMIPDITVSIANRNFEIKPDEDGEERNIDVEVFFDVRIKVYKDEETEVLKDVYSPKSRLEVVRSPIEYESLLGRNVNKLRVTDRVNIGDDNDRILQVCHGSGSVKLDDTSIVENGIRAEGIAEINILYISPDDSRPLKGVKTIIPFSQLVEIKDIDENCVFDIRASLEQVNIVMLDSEEIEVKAGISLVTVVFARHKENIVTEITDIPISAEEIKNMPGMVGYIVKQGDTLWDIAKQYYTTIEDIMELNGLETEHVDEGDRLLLIKKLRLCDASAGLEAHE